MNKLNLVYPERGDILFKLSSFPDGQHQVTILNPISIPLYEEINIISRITNFIDLEIIICTVASLRELGYTNLNLYVGYFLGARSDRKFELASNEASSNNYIKRVISPIINLLRFNKVSVLDPHSTGIENCLNACYYPIDNSAFIKFVMMDMYKSTNPESLVWIAPDEGAGKKIYKLAKKLGFTGTIVECSKERDKDGNITKLVVPDLSLYTNCTLLVIDDICDGGATFINIAKEVYLQYTSKSNVPSMYLAVTHGIFSKKFRDLNIWFKGLYCTNSYKDWADVENGEKTNLKQLNVMT